MACAKCMVRKSGYFPHLQLQLPQPWSRFQSARCHVQAKNLRFSSLPIRLNRNPTAPPPPEEKPAELFKAFTVAPGLSFVGGARCPPSTDFFSDGDGDFVERGLRAKKSAWCVSPFD
jgi:hypothetical protein